jgi:hypothetical protein
MLCVALASGARADTLYWWKTAAGDVEIGPTPPPGVDAVPWDPAAPPPPAKPADPAPKPRATAAPRGARPGRSLRTPASSPAAVDPDECAPHRNLAHGLAAAHREVGRLEARIAELEESKLAHHAYSQCDNAGGGWSRCQGGSYDREEELEKARASLAEKQDALSDLEANARHAEVPRECLRDPNE